MPFLAPRLRKLPCGADAPYPSTSQENKNSLDFSLQRHLTGGGPWVFPPVRLPYALPHLPDLRQSCPTFRKQSVAGLLLLPPTCRPPRVDLILQIWPDRRVARQELVITPGDRLRRPQKLALHPTPGGYGARVRGRQGPTNCHAP